MNGKNKIVILGAGESGYGAAVLAQKQGFDVFVSDMGEIKEEFRKLLGDKEIRFEEGVHTESEILSASEVIKSPGIPDKAPIIKKVKEKNIPVISEIEFGGRYTDSKKICITGTNGKTTTTMLTYHILQKAGLKVGLAGNVGKSFARQVAENDFDYYVIELSSFQLDGLYAFKADVAILLNITPDHLDRYEYDLQKYIDSKFRIFQNQTALDAFIYCADDEIIIAELAKRNINSEKFPFSIKKEEGMVAFVKEDQLNINIKNINLQMSIFDLALQGKHNLYNSMASGIAARVIDIRKDVVRESFSDFKNIEHRLEHVMTVHGIEFINDSKATNINSTWYALECMQKPIVWIVGGIDKGNDYETLKELVRTKVKAIVCMGVDNQKIIDAFGDIIPEISETKTAADAVKSAYEKGRKGDVVLLSPACASFDLFKNYEDRGWQFKKAVKGL